MPIIQCSDCGKDISDKAVTCPHCGAVKVKERKTRKTTTTRVARKKPTSRNIVFGIGVLLVCGAVFFAKSLSPFATTSDPVVMRSYLDDSHTSLLDYKPSIHALIKNNGQTGKVRITFTMYQNAKRYNRSVVKDLQTGEKKDVEQTFEEAKLIDGKITYSVEAKAE